MENMTMTATEQKYKLTGIKMAGGEETPRFEANITINGKKIGVVFNEGCGGDNGYRFVDAAIELEFLTFTKKWGIENKQEFPDADTWVYAELDKFEERKFLLRNSKKKTMFRIKGDEEGAWRTLSIPLCEKSIAYINGKYGDKVEVIFNPAEAA